MHKYLVLVLSESIEDMESVFYETFEEGFFESMDPSRFRRNGESNCVKEVSYGDETMKVTFKLVRFHSKLRLSRYFKGVSCIVVLGNLADMESIRGVDRIGTRLDFYKDTKIPRVFVGTNVTESREALRDAFERRAEKYNAADTCFVLGFKKRMSQGERKDARGMAKNMFKAVAKALYGPMAYLWETSN